MPAPIPQEAARWSPPLRATDTTPMEAAFAPALATAFVHARPETDERSRGRGMSLTEIKRTQDTAEPRRRGALRLRRGVRGSAVSAGSHSAKDIPGRGGAEASIVGGRERCGRQRRCQRDFDQPCIGRPQWRAPTAGSNGLTRDDVYATGVPRRGARPYMPE